MVWDIAGLVLCVASAFILFVSRKWRWNLAALSVAYLGGFLLLYEEWPLEQAAILLVGGWMGAAILGATRQEQQEEFAQDAGVLFRIFLFLILLLVAWSSADGARVWIPGITLESAAAGILLAATGMVRTGIVTEPLQTVMSLLAILAGFEWVFAFVESSALMTALLAVVNLGLAIAGAYLVSYSVPYDAEDEA